MTAVCRRRFFPGRRKSTMLFCEDLTATPEPTQRLDRMSRTLRKAG